MCNYNFQLPVDPLPILEMFGRMIEDNGGTVTGKIPNVSVSVPTQVGRIEGKCQLVGANLVNVHITKKPDVVTCSMVRDRLVVYLSEAVKKYARQTAAVT